MTGAVRIIGGRWRRRQLPVGVRPGLRPTPDRLRETLFNWLGQDLSGWCCLDLCAGTGALGIEAASRGAARVVLVETDRRGCASLRSALQALGASGVEVVSADALEYLTRNQERFDLVFLDPPFQSGLMPGLLAAATPCTGRWLYAEAGGALAAPEGFALWRSGRAGASRGHLFRRDDSA